MPIRVKCRCGQELVVRLNEWVYALLGLLVLSLLVNGTALVTIAIRLDRSDAPPAAKADGSASPEPVLPPPTAATAPAAHGSLEPDAVSPHAPASSVTAADPTPALAIEGPSPAAPQLPEPAPARVDVPAPPAPASLLQGVEPPLLRLLAAAKADDPGLLAAFAKDPDPVVRRWAARQVANRAPPAASSAGDPVLAVGIDGKALALLEASVAATVLRGPPPEHSQPSGMVDLVLAIDGTESMAAALSALQRERWLLPALRWALPDLRVGLLVYTDDVGRCVGLDAPLEELLSALASLRGEGGGDIPEGVHEALKAALQLGRFRWRPLAQKHIVFVGDAPPARGEIPALLSLARECHAEAGFRIHAVSVLPSEGRKATLQFPELAGAGGGRAVTAAEERLAEELFLTLFPAEAHPELTRLLGFLSDGAF